MWLLALSCTLALSVGLGASPWAGGAEYRLKDGCFGAVRIHVIANDESLIELAQAYDLGYNEIVAANPGDDPVVPESGTSILVPTRWLIPDIPRRQGIVINIPEMRLFYFPPGRPKRVVTYPVGIGDEGWDTPTGTYKIIEKQENPAWYVPVSIRKEKPELPAIVPPGPENPLGSHALRLSLSSVLIHGTTRPYGIGRKVSHGCIHLYPEDIPRLYRQVRIGTQVTIVHQPVKVALCAGRVLVEVHGEAQDGLVAEAVRLVILKGLGGRVDWEKLAKAVREMTGVPTDITR